MASIDAIFTSTYHAKQLNPWPNSSSTHIMISGEIIACCLLVKVIWRWIKHSWTSDEPQIQATAKLSSLGNFQHQYLAELLVNVYRYCLMMKIVPCCCVRRRWLFSTWITCESFMQITWPKNYNMHEETVKLVWFDPKCPGLMANSFKEMVK